MKPLIVTFAGVLGAGILAAACAPVQPMEPPIQDGPDQCRASAYQAYVGRHRSTLPARPEGAVWRESCTTCAVTMDYNPRRMNIVYNDRTEIIESLRCG
ncbi:MAG: hemolysin [Brevundimonas sp.]|nr:MAG: hemolysin [Brevundimonas sp.]